MGIMERIINYLDYRSILDQHYIEQHKYELYYLRILSMGNFERIFVKNFEHSNPTGML